MQPMNIIELYKHILGTAALSADDDGMISATFAKTTSPFLIGGKRLVLPTAAQMANPEWENRKVFHPLSENTWRNESEVMERFRHAVNTRLNYTILRLSESLLKIAADQKMHAKLSPTQSELLSAIPDAKEDTLKVFTAIMKAMGLGNKEKCVVHVFLKRNGKIGDKVYARAAVVSSPLYEELEKEGKQVYGVTVTTKQRNTIKSLLKFVVPGIDTAQNFNRGSDSDIAPFLDSLMRGLLAIGQNINVLTDEYAEFLPDSDEYRYDDAWIPVFDNLAQMLPQIRMIPMQAGNEGAVIAKTPIPMQPVAQAPMYGQLAPPPVMQQTGFPPPMQQGFPIQQPQYGQPVAPQAVRTNTGAIDFEASLRANPQLAQQLTVGLSPGYGQPAVGPMATHRAPPRWDQPAPAAQGYWNQPPAQQPSYPPQRQGITGI